LEIIWTPFELHPDTPPEGVPLHEYFGRDSSQFEESYAGLKKRVEELGLPMGGVPSVMSNSNRILRLAEYARDNGVFDRLHLPAFEAYFADDRNLGDDAVLRELGEEAGLDPDEAILVLDGGDYEDRIENAMRRAREYGITGTPTFVIESRYGIVGAQPYEVLRDGLRKMQEEMG
jgi:predicted DsbA family dithiol-disulfide isomerase